MATLKITVTPGKKAKDGSHKIRVAIGHRQVTRYIVTNFKISNLSQFKNGQVVKRPDAGIINTKLRNLLNEYQERLDSIKHIEMYTCKQVREMLLHGYDGCASNATFQYVAMEYAKELISSNRGNYAKLIERNCRYFTEFCKGDSLLSDITPELIENYEKFLRRKGSMGDTTIGMMMSRTRTIINRGIKHRLVMYDVHPFTGFKIRSSPVREVDISVESFNKIRLSDFNEKKYRVARDLFCLSLYLGGINLIDLLSIDFRECDIIKYVRTKSKSTTQGRNVICITIPEQAKPIIKTWMNKKTGMLDFGYKFSYQNFYRYLTRSLNSLSLKLGIKEKLVYYSARKSFAQYASEIGIPDSVINYCLGHSDKSRGVIRYYTKIRQKQAEFAINRVIDYVEHPDKYKDYIEMNASIMMAKI